MRSKRILALLILGVCLLELGSAVAATTAAPGQHRSLLEVANTTSSTASPVNPSSAHTATADTAVSTASVDTALSTGNVATAIGSAAAGTAVSTADVDTVVSAADVGTAVSTESVELSSKHSKWHEPRDGMDGIDGKDGEDGPRGPSGPSGKPGKPGKAGATGADGQGLTYRYVTTDVATKTVNYDAATGQTDFAGTLTAGAKCARGFHARACSCDTGMDPAFESFTSQTEDGGYPDSTNVLGSSNVRLVESRLVAMEGKHQNACACMALYTATVGPDEGQLPSDDEEYDDADDGDDDEKGDVYVVKVSRPQEKGSHVVDRPQLSRSEYYDHEDDFADDASYKPPATSTPPSLKYPEHKDYKEDKQTGGDYDPHSKTHSGGEEYQKQPEHKEHPNGKDYHKYEEPPSKETYTGDGKGPGSYSGGKDREGEYGYHKERESHEPSSHRKEPHRGHPPSGKSVYDKGKQGKWGLPPHLYKPVPYRKEYYSSKQHDKEHYTADRRRHSSGGRDGYKKGPYADQDATEDGHTKPAGPYKPQPPRHVYEAIPPKAGYSDKGSSYPDKPGAPHAEKETDEGHYPDVGPMKPEDLDDAPDEPYQHAPPADPKPLPPYDEYSSDDHGRYSHHAPGQEPVRHHGGRAKKPRRRNSPYYTKGTKRLKRNRAKNAQAWISGSKKDATDHSTYLDIVVAQWPSEQSFMLSATAVCVKEGSS